MTVLDPPVTPFKHLCSMRRSAHNARVPAPEPRGERRAAAGLLGFGPREYDAALARHRRPRVHRAFPAGAREDPLLLPLENSIDPNL